jgi:hypothetical protein
MSRHSAIYRPSVSLQCRSRRLMLSSTRWTRGRRDSCAVARPQVQARGKRHGNAKGDRIDSAQGDCRRRADDRRRTHGNGKASWVSESDLKALSIEVLQEVARDRAAPAAARAAAARTLLELLGEIGRLQVEKRSGTESPLGELSAADLDREIARLAALAAPQRKARYRLL